MQLPTAPHGRLSLRSVVFASTCALGLLAVGCSSLDAGGLDQGVDAPETIGTTSLAVSIVTTPAQRARIQEICQTNWGTQTPAIHYASAEPLGFGTYEESSVWTQSHCSGDGLSFLMNWSRGFGEYTLNTTLSYDFRTGDALTVTSDCTGMIGRAWGQPANTVAADYVCDNANAALRTWIEDGNVGSVAPTFLKHNNNGTASCDEFCGSRGGTEWVGNAWGGGAGRCVSARRGDTGQAIACSVRPGFLGGPELTCRCSNAQLKGGNNGTVSCVTFCGGAQWGGFSGTCVGGYDVTTRRSIGCGAPGAIGNFTCACLPTPPPSPRPDPRPDPCPRCIVP